MIYRVFSNLASFQELELKPGFNLLLAEKSSGATDRDTRNGAGKTSLIELIHFVLGGNARKDNIFRSEKLAPFYFGLDLDLRGGKVSVKRSGLDSGKFFVKSGISPEWPIQPKREKNTGATLYSLTHWRALLGEFCFGLRVSETERRGGFAPTFRSLFCYFARRQDSAAFVSHISQSSKQQPWDQQVAISYLFGIDWSISQDFQKLRELEKTIRQLKQSAKKGTLPGFEGSAAVLRTQLTIEGAKARNLKEQLDEFNVVPEYQSIERQASALTLDMNRLGNENTADRQLLKQLENSLQHEQPPELNDLKSLYGEAGVILPDLILRRFDEALTFHRAIIDNRRAHLRTEIQRAQNRIEQRDRQKATMGARRAQLMDILKSGGALDQYTLLQEEYSRLQSNVENLRQQLVITEKLESEKTKSEIERRQNKERLSQDFHEQASALNEAIVLFQEFSGALYERERAGSLTIGATDNGPTFEVRIDAQRSRGITNMQIFCFDMVLAVIAARRDQSPGFLIHDSHLFDGVDERQIAKALQIGKTQAEKYGFQYLAIMNSDVIPEDGLDPNFDLNEYIVSVRLDDTVQGSLFGLRFN